MTLNVQLDVCVWGGGEEAHVHDIVLSSENLHFRNKNFTQSKPSYSYMYLAFQKYSVE